MTAPSLWRRIRNTLSNPRRKRAGTVDVTPDKLLLRLNNREAELRWADIDRIDAGMRDYLGFDGFYVVLFARTQKLELDELDDGFRQLEVALFERWPQIRARWNALLGSLPHQPQHETLWQRDAA